MGNHAKTAFTLQAMGKIYFSYGLEEGESLVKESLKILESKNNSKIFSTLEIIADIEFYKAKEYSKSGNKLKAEHHFRMAQEYMDKSLQVAKKNLPSDSKRILLLKEKVTKLTLTKIFNN